MPLFSKITCQALEAPALQAFGNRLAANIYYNLEVSPMVSYMATDYAEFLADPDSFKVVDRDLYPSGYTRVEYVARKHEGERVLSSANLQALMLKLERVAEDRCRLV